MYIMVNPRGEIKFREYSVRFGKSRDRGVFTALKRLSNSREIGVNRFISAVIRIRKSFFSHTFVATPDVIFLLVHPTFGLRFSILDCTIPH